MENTTIETNINNYWSMTMKRIQTLICSLLAIGVISLFLIGCHTFRGMGEDIEYSGKKIQNVADHDHDSEYP